MQYIISIFFTLWVVSFQAVSPSFAEEAEGNRLDSLFEQLAQEDLSEERWREIESAIWQEWSQSGSRSVDFLLRRGISALQAQDFNAAIGHFTAAIDHSPYFAEAWNKRATVYFHMGLYGLSMADIEQTLVLEPRHFGALAGMGLILQQTDRTEDALNVYEEALKHHPHRPDLLLARKRLIEAQNGKEL